MRRFQIRRSKDDAERNLLCAPIPADCRLRASLAGTSLLKTLAVPVGGLLRPPHARRCTGSGPDCPGTFGTAGIERSPVGGRRRASAPGSLYSAPFRANAAITRRIRVTGVPLCIW